MIEEALRDMFANRAEAAPVADDPASVAIGAARERARRRTLAGGFAVAITLVVVVGGAFGMRGWWLPMHSVPDSQANVLGGGGNIQFGPVLTDADLATQPIELTLDVYVGGGRIASSSGRWYALDGVGDVLTVVRVPAGWIYGGADRVRLMRTDGTAVDLLDQAMPWLVSPHGDQLVAVAERRIRSWPLTEKGLGAPITATVPAGVVPISFVGDRVMLRDAEGMFDYWQPQGGYQPTWKFSFTTIFDSLSADTYGLFEGPRQCLVRVSARAGGLTRGSALGCGLSLDAAATRAVISPDGSLLAVPTPKGLNIVDLAGSRIASALESAGEPIILATCEADFDTVPVWSATNTVVSTAAGGLIACSVDGPRRPVKLPVGVAGSGWKLVPIRA